MSLMLGLLVSAGGVVLGRALARRLRARPSEEGGEQPPSTPSAADTLDTFPCHLGDVVVRTAERDEAWLAGALLFEEERTVVGALFVAPEAGVDRALFARDAVEDIIWLSPIPTAELALTAEPPHVVDRGGVRFQRTRRLPVGVRRAGSGAPSVGDRAIVAEYEGPGPERIVIVAGSERTLAWAGAVLGRAEYDVLPGGKETLE